MCSKKKKRKEDEEEFAEGSNQKYSPSHPQIFVFCVLTNEGILREAGYR